MSHHLIPLLPSSRTGRAGRTRSSATGARRTPPPPDPRELVSRNIARYGLHVVHVGEGCDCPDCTSRPLPPSSRFGYTIGLTEEGHSELIVRGLGARETARLLDRWGRTVLEGDVFEVGDLLCGCDGGDRWEVVRADGRELVWAYEHYGRPAHDAGPALALVRATTPCPCAGPC